MFKIDLKNITREGTKYCVFLDAGMRFDFDNKRKAQDFLRSVSERLTENLVYVNNELIEAYAAYRNYYFIIEDFKMRFDLEHEIQGISERIFQLTFRNNNENGNYLAVTGIEKMLFSLRDVFETIRAIAISRSETTVRHSMTVKLTNLDLRLAEYRKLEDQLSIKNSNIVVERLNYLHKVS